jgi:c-di-GMP-binding flagellar brake protein YcgR
MKYTELEIGLKLEIKLAENDDLIINEPFVSEFEGIENKEILVIAAPIYKGHLYPVKIGAQITITFVTDNNLYEFLAKVIARENKHNVAMLKIQPQGQIEKVQRREFFRFDTSIPVKFRIIDNINSKSTQDYIETVTRDLSGGGLCMRLKEPIEIDSYIECELFLSCKVTFIGKVVRLTKYDTMQGQYKYEIGVYYEMRDQITREKVISYIFQEQRRLLKKG